MGTAIDGDTVSIRAVTEADCDQRYLGWLQDERVNRHLETRWTGQSLASIRAFVRAMHDDPAQHLFAIIHAGRHVGNVKLGPVDRRHGCADLSYFVGDTACWGRGIAGRAIALVLAHGFIELDLARIQAGVYASNHASIRVLEKLGFVHEGAWRRQLLGSDGREDHLWYGLLREEWEART